MAPRVGLSLCHLPCPCAAASKAVAGACGSPCCPGRWRSAPASWLQCARPSCPRGPRCDSLQGWTGQGCWKHHRHGEGRGALPLGARPSLLVGLPKGREGQLCESQTGVSLPGLPTCFGISQRHLCQPLAAELVLDGAIFTQDAWETNLGSHRGGTAGASVPRGVWLWGQAVEMLRAT